MPSIFFFVQLQQQRISFTYGIFTLLLFSAVNNITFAEIVIRIDLS